MRVLAPTDPAYYIPRDPNHKETFALFAFLLTLVGLLMLAFGAHFIRSGEYLVAGFEMLVGLWYLGLAYGLWRDR